MTREIHIFLHSVETEVLTDINRKLDQLLKGEKTMAGELDTLTAKVEESVGV